MLWKLIDHETNLRNSSWSVSVKEVPNAPHGFSIGMRRLETGLSQDVDFIEVNNGKFQFSIVPTRGMGIWHAALANFRIGWQSPVRGPVHPRFVQLSEPSGLGWLDGFDELMCRCGLVNNGAPDFDKVTGRLVYPVHGRIANRPAHLVEVSVDGNEIKIMGIVEETRFHFTKFRLKTTISTRFNEPGLRIHDEVENFSGTEAEMQMLYHINFGTPLLEPGAEVVVPIDTLVPRTPWAAAGVGHWSTYTEPTAGMEERVYFFKVLADSRGDSQALLKNAKEDRGVSVQFKPQQLSCFTLWKNETSLSDGYVTGIEPGTNYPNPRSFETEQGRVIKIKPGATYTMDVGLKVHGSAAEVATVENEIRQVQSRKAPTIYEKPQPGWCA
jgi:galactose mutarotase-like enzyme